MKSISLLCVFICMLSGCLDVAPDEQWDYDDTRIWIKEASALDLDPFWFKEDTTSLAETILSYKQDFEADIIDQIRQSPDFNQPILPSKTSSVDSIKGIWQFAKNGYQFFQFQGNQYPMSISIDTLENRIKIQ